MVIAYPLCFHNGVRLHIYHIFKKKKKANYTSFLKSEMYLRHRWWWPEVFSQSFYCGCCLYTFLKLI